MDEGISCAALREAKLLRELQGGAGPCGPCPHIIQLLDVFCHKQRLLMVFECMETDLGSVIRCGAPRQPMGACRRWALACMGVTGRRQQICARGKGAAAPLRSFGAGSSTMAGCLQGVQGQRLP